MASCCIFARISSVASTFSVCIGNEENAAALLFPTNFLNSQSDHQVGSLVSQGSGASNWEHPRDSFYKSIYQQKKASNELRW